MNVVKKELVWPGTINTPERDDVEKAIKAYVETVIGVLMRRTSSVRARPSNKRRGLLFHRFSRVSQRCAERAWALAPLLCPMANYV
jgi:hypothetical protein